MSILYKHKDLKHLHNISRSDRISVNFWLRKFDIKATKIYFTADNANYKNETNLLTSELIDKIIFHIEKYGTTSTRQVNEASIKNLQRIQKRLNGDLDAKQIDKKQTQYARQLGKNDFFFTHLKRSSPEGFRFCEMYGRGNLANGYRKLEKYFESIKEFILAEDLKYKSRLEFGKKLSKYIDITPLSIKNSIYGMEWSPYKLSKKTLKVVRLIKKAIENINRMKNENK